MSYVDRMGDVPSVLRFDGRKWPLGRYLKSRALSELEGTIGRSVRVRVGRSDYTPGYVLRLEEMQFELEKLDAREAREERRKNHALSAAARVRISQSKKGLL